MDINAIWNKIEAHEGQEFHTTTGKPFTYMVKGSILKPDGKNRNISRSNFETALSRMPLNKVTQLSDLQGPAYIYGILTDKRITG